MTREEGLNKAINIVVYFEAHFAKSKEAREEAENIIEALEQEPKTGRWIKTIGENGITSAVRCSECGFEDNRYMLFRYCPNCGAKMQEVEE